MKKISAKRAIIFTVIAVLLIAPSVVFAGSNSSGYSFTVPKYTDKEDGTLKKKYDEPGENKVTSVNGALGCWLETYNVNCTYKVYYSTTGVKQMDYRPSGTEDEYINMDLKLNVSTALSQMSSVKTSGKWSPDEL